MPSAVLPFPLRACRWGGAVVPIREGVPPRIRRRVATPDPFQQIGLVPFVDTVHNRLTVEIRRGCTRGCRSVVDICSPQKGSGPSGVFPCATHLPRAPPVQLPLPKTPTLASA